MVGGTKREKSGKPVLIEPLEAQADEALATLSAESAQAQTPSGARSSQGRPRPRDGRSRCRAAHRAPLRGSRPRWASIVPSLRSADASGPAL